MTTKTVKKALLPIALAVALLSLHAHGLEIGVNIHSGGGTPTANGQLASVMAARNIQQARMDIFPWVDVNQLRDQIIKIRANGGLVQLIIHNSAEWDSSCNQNLAAVEQNSYNLAYNQVSQFKDLVDVYEVFNEVQFQSWINAEVPRNSAGTSAAPYANKPCVASLTAAIRGAERAVVSEEQVAERRDVLPLERGHGRDEVSAAGAHRRHPGAPRGRRPDR